MAALQHIMIVGGSLVEWGELSDAAWASRCSSLGVVAGAAGARWLTLRPFERGHGADGARPVQHGVVDHGGCTVIVDPDADGRDHLVVALRKLAESDQLTDAAIAPALLAPAEVEPDLVLLLGTNDRLPTSLVWELAYSELVYVDVAWADLSSQHLSYAIAAYQGRHRRFGGLD
jgi:undecaprenyl diphosphate synthase